MPEHVARNRSRRFGYIVSIILNLLILYGVNNLVRWEVPYLTEDFSNAVWAFNLSLSVSIFMYAVFLFFDRRWFKHFMVAITNLFSIVSMYVFWKVFPIDIPESTVYWVNSGLFILMGAVLLSAILEVVNAIRAYRKSVQAE